MENNFKQENGSSSINPTSPSFIPSIETNVRSETNSTELEHESGSFDYPCAVCVAEAWWRDQQRNNNSANPQEETTFLKTSEIETDVSTNNFAYVPSYDIETSNSNAESCCTEEYHQQINANLNERCNQKKGLFFANITMLNLQELLRSFGISNITTDFDEFYLLVIKAFLFNIFTYKGPEVYNRILLKIRHTVRDFMAQVEERERKEALEKEQNFNTTNSNTN